MKVTSSGASKALRPTEKQPFWSLWPGSKSVKLTLTELRAMSAPGFNKVFPDARELVYCEQASEISYEYVPPLQYAFPNVIRLRIEHPLRYTKIFAGIGPHITELQTHEIYADNLYRFPNLRQLHAESILTYALGHDNHHLEELTQLTHVTLLSPSNGSDSAMRDLLRLRKLPALETLALSVRFMMEFFKSASATTHFGHITLPDTVEIVTVTEEQGRGPVDIPDLTDACLDLFLDRVRGDYRIEGTIRICKRRRREK